ncbi:MAG TPA: polymer-forming cytoskeletal protein [Terriglobales bacterium]|nr:polymer-forming cytoskeletal protein [Terriglobales bacterium]
MWSPSRPNSNSPQPSPQESNASAPRNTAPSIQPYKDGGTYIGKSIVIKGELSGDEPIQVDGRVEGPISLREGRVNIGRDASVTSHVRAAEVIVRGTLEGNVTATDRVEVHSGGSLTGDVTAGRVTVELGAFFHGKVDMKRPDPKAHIEIPAARDSKPKVNELEESHALALR